MKKFVNSAIILSIILTFNACKKDKTLTDNINKKVTFEDFQKTSGKKLTKATDKSNNEYDVYIYTYDNPEYEPLNIIIPKENNNKDIYPEIPCDKAIMCLGGRIFCMTPFDECSVINFGGSLVGITICDWGKAMRCVNGQEN